MKKKTILKSFLLSILILAVSSQAFASEVTGNLSSAGVSTQQSGGSSEVTGTLASSAVTSGSGGTGQISGTVTGGTAGQITGTVTGGTSGGGSSSGGGGGSSGGGSGGSNGNVGLSSNQLTGSGQVLGVSISNYSPTNEFTSDGLAFQPRLSRLALLAQQEEYTELTLAEEILPIPTVSAQVNEEILKEDRYGLLTWFWIILLLLLLLAIGTYTYIRYSEKPVRHTR